MSAEPVPPTKRSGAEVVKENSRFLRGTIAEDLAAGGDHFNDQNKNLLKFHGTYQQDDRDARKDPNRQGSGRAYMFMVRCKIPGGKVSADQYLSLDDLAGKFGNGTLRVTSRQGFQFHGIVKKGLKSTIAGINETLLSTLGACGDVERNVMAPAAPWASTVYRQLQETSDRIAAHLAPRTSAYHEIWLDGEAVHDVPPNPEPIYGKVYLPRKFKTGLALPEDNSVDIYAQDLGLLGIVEKDDLIGFNVLAGGGMGMSHGNDKTFPFLAQAICYVTRDQVVPAAEGVIKLFRDNGNRADRKRARLKYVLHDWGVEKFRDVLAKYLPFPLVLPKPVRVSGFPLDHGWNAQGDGKFFYGISIENGRIKDEGRLRLRSALKAIVEKYRPDLRLTPMQDILLCNLPESARGGVESTLLSHGVRLPATISQVRRHSIACPAVPTCGLALSESERVFPGFLDELEKELTRLGLDKELLSVRMTGCPNGCARPYQSDIGIVGRSGDKYTLFVGGNLVGDRLNFVLKDLVPLNEIVTTLKPLLTDYSKSRINGEGFGDYCVRLGADNLWKRVEGNSGA